MNGISAGVDQALRPALLFRQDDLRQHHLGDVVAAVAVNDADVVTCANQVRDSVKRHVLAAAGVVQLAVRVLLDKVAFRPG